MHLAVYGTLRRGGPANHLLKGATYVGRDTIPGKIYNLSVFPAWKPEGEGRVVVDLYELTSPWVRTLQGIDKYEGCFPESPDQSIFHRRLVTTGRGIPSIAYAYKFDTSSFPQIKSGDWADVAR